VCAEIYLREQEKIRLEAKREEKQRREKSAIEADSSLKEEGVAERERES
jgi:hypothetical protein